LAWWIAAFQRQKKLQGLNDIVKKMFKKPTIQKKQNTNINELIDLAKQKGLKVPEKVVK
jgi:hypothetical protein